MLDAPMLDPMGALIVEIRSDDDVADLVDARVRAQEPHGATKTYEGDALGPGKYKAFVVLTTLSAPPHPRVPITFAEYGIRCYGVDHKQARAVFNAVVKAVHAAGPRLKASGLGIYRSAVTGGADDRDPDTKQPVVTGSIQLIATTQAVTA